MMNNIDTLSSHNIWAIVPAAGIGTRMASDIPKQYLPLASLTVLEITLRKIVSLPFVDGVVVALHADDSYWEALAIASHPKIQVVTGGDSRQASVTSALTRVQQCALPDSWVFVHDAARPCVDPVKIEELCSIAISEKVASILAKPVTDTVKKSIDGKHILQTENRNHLWLAHTPQMFPLNELIAAFAYGEDKGMTFTDEASAYEAIGNPLRLVPDNSHNMKITIPADLPLAEYILQQQHIGSEV